MKQDIRKEINNSFLYKRFAYYQSEGFIELMKFLKNENLIDKFYEECNFNKESFINYLKHNKGISIDLFFGYSKYSFSFTNSKFGVTFWNNKIFNNKNFQKISDKIL